MKCSALLAAVLDRRQSEAGETVVENRLIDPDAFRDELAVNRVQVGYEAAPAARFQQANASHDVESPRLRQPSCRAFIQNDQLRTERISEQHRGKFACAEWMKSSQLRKLVSWRGRMNFNPSSYSDSARRGPSGSTNDDLLVDFTSDVNMGEKFAQQFQTSYARQRNQRRSIADNDHSFRRAASSRSSSKSASA